MSSETENDQSFIQHLEALRTALIRCLICIGIALPVCFFIAPKILDFFIVKLAVNLNVTLSYFSPMEVFLLQIKIALFASLVVSFPLIAKNIWDFILPALHVKERKFIKSVVLTSTLLFCEGAAFCFFIIMPLLMGFGLSFQSEHLQAVLGVSTVVTLALRLSFVFGLGFQTPLITYALLKSGLVSYESLASKRSYIFVGTFIASVLVTPPDVLSLILLALPIYILFEVGLLFSRPFKSVKPKEEE